MPTHLNKAFVALGSYIGIHVSQTTSVTHVLLALIGPPLLITLLDPGSSIFLNYAVHCLTFVAALVAYRLSPLHPLYKYPGPPLARITKFYFVFGSMSGKQYLWAKKIHDKYGDIVRIGPNELSFNSPSYVHPILGPGGMPKASFYDGRFYNPNPAAPHALIGIRIPSEHARRRKAWQTAFSSENQKNYHLIIERRGLQLAECFEKIARSGETVDLARWVGRFTYDFMMDLIFDGGSELMRDGDGDGLWDMMEQAYPYAQLISLLPWIAPTLTRYPSLHGFLRALIPHYAPEGLKRFRDFAVAQSTERKARGSNNKDLFYHFLNASEGSKSPAKAWGEVLSDSSIAIVGGADTTSISLSHTFFFLMTHPDEYKKLREELDAEDSDTFDTLRNAHLPYLNAVINETLRLYPPVLSGSPREPLIGSGGLLLGNDFIPEGTTCDIPFYTLHRDPRNFSPSPDEFIPARWLGDASSKYTTNREAFIPFSHGPANCVGKHLAIHELRMIVRLLVERFEFELDETRGWTRDRWGDNLEDYYVTIKGGLPVKIKLRE